MSALARMASSLVLVLALTDNKVRIGFKNLGMLGLTAAGTSVIRAFLKKKLKILQVF